MSKIDSALNGQQRGSTDDIFNVILVPNSYTYLSKILPGAPCITAHFTPSFIYIYIYTHTYIAFKSSPLYFYIALFSLQYRLFQAALQ